MIQSSQFRFLLLLAFVVLALIVSLTRSIKPSEDTFIQKNPLQNKFTPTVLVLDISSVLFFQPSGGGGVIGVEKWIAQLDSARKDPLIKGVLVRMNSPGGSIVASQELFDAMKRFRESNKPLVVSIADICASGGYYISLPATKIIANRGSLIGSIGVRISNNDVSELLKKVGISSREIKSVPFKDILSPTRKMTDEERRYVQSLVDRMHEQFVSDVIAWRGEKSSPDILNDAANGLLYLSEEAIEKGLIDEIGNYESAKQAIAEETGIAYDELTFRKANPLSWWQENLWLNIQALNQLPQLIHTLQNILPTNSYVQ